MNDFIGKYIYTQHLGQRNDIYYSGPDGITRLGRFSFTLGFTYRYLKDYYPSEARALYTDDPELLEWRGFLHSTSPDGFRAIWMKVYNRVGQAEMYNTQIKFLEDTFERLTEQLKDNERDPNIIDLIATDSRALNELLLCMYIESGTFDGFLDRIFKLRDRMKEKSFNRNRVRDFIDAIFDSEIVKNNPTERKILQSLTNEEERIIGAGSNEVVEADEEEWNVDVRLPFEEPVIDVEVVIKKAPVIKKSSGTIKVVYRDEEGVPIYEDIYENPIDKAKYGDTFEIIGKTIGEHNFYQLKDERFITAESDKVIMAKTEDEALYSVRIKAANISIKEEPKDDSKTTGKLMKNQVFSIIKEDGDYGFLKSGAGWIKIDESVKKLKR